MTDEEEEALWKITAMINDTELSSKLLDSDQIFIEKYQINLPITITQPIVVYRCGWYC